MRKLLILLLTGCNPAYAFEPVKLKEVYLIHRTFRAGSRNPVFDNAQLSNREVGQEVSLHFNTSFLNEYVYWDNHVLSYVARWKGGGPEQFRNVGWEFQVGVQPCEYMRIGYHHFSKHMLDAKYVGMNFPVEDALEFRVWLYK